MSRESASAMKRTRPARTPRGVRGALEARECSRLPPPRRAPRERAAEGSLTRAGADPAHAIAAVRGEHDHRRRRRVAAELAAAVADLADQQLAAAGRRSSAGTRGGRAPVGPSALADARPRCRRARRARARRWRSPAARAAPALVGVGVDTPASATPTGRRSAGSAGNSLRVLTPPVPGPHVLSELGRDARDLRGVIGAAVDVEVRHPRAAIPAALVEEVVAVPLVGLRRAVVLHDRRRASGRSGSRSTCRQRGGDPRRLLGEEVDDARAR